MLLQGSLHRLSFSLKSRTQCHCRLQCRAEPHNAAKVLVNQNKTVCVANPEGGVFSLVVQVPTGADVYQVSLKKPLGLTLTGVSWINVQLLPARATATAAAAALHFTKLYAQTSLKVYKAYVGRLFIAPLGYCFAERSGSILVDEVSPGGHAAAAGVAAGDKLLATTARTQVPDAANGVTQLVLLPIVGQSFKTVAAALRSNTCSQCLITLVLQRQQPSTGAEGE